MKRRTRNILGVFLLVVYTVFFVSTNLCYHSHIVAGKVIVHSHLFGGKSHSHTGSQLVHIEAVNHIAYNVSAPVTPAELTCVIIPETATVLYTEAVPEVFTPILSLRAPPCV